MVDAGKPELVRLSGLVRETSDPPAARWLLVVKGAIHERRQAGWIVVDLDGHPVRVELGNDVVGGAALVTHDGRFRALNARAGGVFPSNLASPFALARLTIHALEPGDLVELTAAVLERTLDDDGGYRNAPTARLGHLRALLVTRRAASDSARSSAPPPSSSPTR